MQKITYRQWREQMLSLLSSKPTGTAIYSDDGCYFLLLDGFLCSIESPKGKLWHKEENLVQVDSSAWNESTGTFEGATSATAKCPFHPNPEFDLLFVAKPREERT